MLSIGQDSLVYHGRVEAEVARVDDRAKCALKHKHDGPGTVVCMQQRNRHGRIIARVPAVLHKFFFSAARQNERRAHTISSSTAAFASSWAGVFGPTCGSSETVCVSFTGRAI